MPRARHWNAPRSASKNGCAAAAASFTPGPGPRAGSRCSTAQRVALTVLSSLVMIRLGRVYEGLMIDVQASNTKLVRRSETILAQLTGHGRDRVREALRQARGSVKLALLLLEGSNAGDARS